MWITLRNTNLGPANCFCWPIFSVYSLVFQLIAIMDTASLHSYHSTIRNDFSVYVDIVSSWITDTRDGVSMLLYSRILCCLKCLQKDLTFLNVTDLWSRSSFLGACVTRICTYCCTAVKSRKELHSTFWTDENLPPRKVLQFNPHHYFSW